MVDHSQLRPHTWAPGPACMRPLAAPALQGCSPRRPAAAPLPHPTAPPHPACKRMGAVPKCVSLVVAPSCVKGSCHASTTGGASPGPAGRNRRLPKMQAEDGMDSRPLPPHSTPPDDPRQPVHCHRNQLWVECRPLRTPALKTLQRPPEATCTALRRSTISRHYKLGAHVVQASTSVTKPDFLLIASHVPTSEARTEPLVLVEAVK